MLDLKCNAGAVALADAIKDNGALSSLNLANNGLGEMVLPEGWQPTGRTEWTHTDGSKATADPSKPYGIIALANVIPSMGALTSLDISTQADRHGGVEQPGGLTAEGAKYLAEALKDHP
jgi:hypothetical protein